MSHSDIAYSSPSKIAMSKGSATPLRFFPHSIVDIVTICKAQEKKYKNKIKKLSNGMNFTPTSLQVGFIVGANSFVPPAPIKGEASKSGKCRAIPYYLLWERN
jgi:hypothetical protein